MPYWTSPKVSTHEENEPPQGKVHRFRGKVRHFPRGWKRQVAPERSVEPVPQPAMGESEPFSRKNPALSPEEGDVCSWKGLEI